MVKPNWDVFRAKFSGDTQGNFEWFSYLLFCREFDRPKGLFRYKNQSGLETNPIEVDDTVIGWQAKFYDTSLSKHKDDLIKTIKTVKRNYPKVQKLHIYTNQEWGQNKGKKPSGLIEVERLANSLDIELTWKMASFFDSAFVALESEDIASHFFSTENSVIFQIQEQQQHTANLLNSIQTKITFGNNAIEIDRTELVSALQTALETVYILSGAGGVGKTGVVKNLYG